MKIIFLLLALVFSSQALYKDGDRSQLKQGGERGRGRRLRLREQLNQSNVRLADLEAQIQALQGALQGTTIPDFFSCGNGIIVPMSYVQDGENDCLDGSDEQPLGGDVSQLKQGGGEGRGRRRGRLGQRLRRNRRRMRALEAQIQALLTAVEEQNSSSGLFSCGNGIFIPMSLVRDGNSDCTDGRDEVPVASSLTLEAEPTVLEEVVSAPPPTTTTQSPTQPPTATQPPATEPCTGQWQCGDGECIPLSYVNDGFFDCFDGSDESRRLCTEDEHRCGDQRCIPLRWVRDGQEDCEDGSDELPEGESVCDTDMQFDCGNNMCIPTSWQCDGTPDCHNGSDEDGCSATKSHHKSHPAKKASQVNRLLKSPRKKTGHISKKH